MSNQPSWLKYGLIYGILSFTVVIISTYIFPIGIWTQAAIGILVFAFLARTQILEFRAENGGFNDFGTTFKQLFLMCLIAVTLSSILTYILYVFVDGDAYQETLQRAVDSSIGMMESMGMPEAEIEKTREQLEEATLGKQYGFMDLIQGLFGGVIGSALFSAIAGAFLKKNQNYDNVL
jgi:hypothetical protein